MTWPEEFAPQAIHDVEAAVDWLADHGGAQIARRMALATMEAARRVVQRPLTGHLRPELLPTPYRFSAVRGFLYLLVYDASRTPAKVLRVLHMSRDLGQLLADLAEPPDEGPRGA